MSNSAVSIPTTVTSSTRKKDADYVFYELTRSICPQCRKVIDAKILLRDNKVFMSKRCPDCGPFEALVYGMPKPIRSSASSTSQERSHLPMGLKSKTAAPATADSVQTTSSTHAWA